MKKLVYSIFMVIFLMMSCNYSYAFQRKRFKVCNNTGGACSAFQADFTGGGGNLAAKIIVNPCGYAPTITITPSTPGDIVFIFWGTNCVAPGACVTFDVYTNNGPLTYTGGCWMNTTFPTFPGAGLITLGTNLFNIPILILNANCYLPAGNLLYASNPFYQNGVNSFFDVFFDITVCNPLPAPGNSSILNTNIAVSGNSSYGPFSATVPATIRMTYDREEEGTRFYETEMLMLDLAGGGLPPLVRLRESPSLASLGKTTYTDIGGGQYAVSSFFDIFTEVTTDGGSSWQPSQAGPSHTEVNPPPPLVIPTLSEWGLIILGIVLLAAGVWFIIRRRTAAVL